MKTIKSLCITALISVALAGCSQVSYQSRDLAYEHYCDSIWENDQDYYLDCLMETDEYISYVEQHGTWWK